MENFRGKVVLRIEELLFGGNKAINILCFSSFVHYQFALSLALSVEEELDLLLGFVLGES